MSCLAAVFCTAPNDADAASPGDDSVDACGADSSFHDHGHEIYEKPELQIGGGGETYDGLNYMGLMNCKLIMTTMRTTAVVTLLMMLLIVAAPES